MTDLRKAAEMALEVLLKYRSDDAIQHYAGIQDSITFLRQALAEPQQEPVAWMGIDSWGVVNKFRTNQFGGAIPLYKTPPKREWVGLTDEEIYDYADKFLYSHGSNYGIKSFGKAIEAKLKEKNA